MRDVGTPADRPEQGRGSHGTVAESRVRLAAGSAGVESGRLRRLVFSAVSSLGPAAIGYGVFQVVFGSVDPSTPFWALRLLTSVSLASAAALGAFLVIRILLARADASQALPATGHETLAVSLLMFARELGSGPGYKARLARCGTMWGRSLDSTRAPMRAC